MTMTLTVEMWKILLWLAASGFAGFLLGVLVMCLFGVAALADAYMFENGERYHEQR